MKPHPQRNAVLAEAVYRALDETRVPHQRISQRKMMERLVADVQLCAVFFDAKPPGDRQRTVEVVRRLIDWIWYFSEYHRDREVRIYCRDSHQELWLAVYGPRR
jgi:hypothetical protein